MNKADLTRWSWVEIDRGALRRNTRAYKNLLDPRQRLCCVVKADAYGHGAVECAKIMYSAGADMFAVATVNEGVELRKGGITKPVLILSEPPIEAIPTLLEFDIMPSVYTSDFALAFGECAVAAGKVGKYHLAIETGIVHCANTPSSMLDPSMHFDMIRAGVGLYGMQPCELSGRVMQLDPVMSVHARVTRVAHPAMGEGVGYGFTYRVPRTRVQICTLPIGYADGLSRTLSNRMDVLYRGERVRQVGNICMDQFMVAIQSNPAHEIPEAEHGDEMIIVGRDGDAEITMDEMARLRGTINYEVACGFGMRLDKVYV